MQRFNFLQKKLLKYPQCSNSLTYFVIYICVYSNKIHGIQKGMKFADGSSFSSISFRLFIHLFSMHVLHSLSLTPLVNSSISIPLHFKLQTEANSITFLRVSQDMRIYSRKKRRNASENLRRFKIG